MEEKIITLSTPFLVEVGGKEKGEITAQLIGKICILREDQLLLWQVLF